MQKLAGILDAQAHVVEEHKWQVNILHIWAQSPHVLAVTRDTLSKLPDELWRDTIVVCSLCERMEHVIFKNTEDFNLPIPYHEVR